MQIMVRDRDYPELSESLRGKRVLIWTCNTCARLCNMGGSANAMKLANQLRADGVEITGILSSKAACITKSVIELKSSKSLDCDIILALTCNIGSKVASDVFGRPCINPVSTLGAGYLDGEGRPVLIGMSEKDEASLVEAASSRCLSIGPFY